VAFWVNVRLGAPAGAAAGREVEWKLERIPDGVQPVGSFRVRLALLQLRHEQNQAGWFLSPTALAGGWMTRWSRPMDQPFQAGPLQMYRGIRVEQEYRYQRASTEGQSARRGESCTVRRITAGEQPGTVLITVEFADGEKVPVPWSALRGVRERTRR